MYPEFFSLLTIYLKDIIIRFELKKIFSQYKKIAMPIKGKIKAIKHRDCIENMEVGTSGFLEIEEVIVTQKAVFISIFAQVFNEDDDDDDFIPLIPVTRIGSGLTSDDFEIDFTNIDDYDMPSLETHATYLDLIKNKKQFVIFEEFDMECSGSISSQKNTESNQGSKGSKEIEEKKKELEQAEKDEDFEKASKLRDEIISLQKKH